MTFCSVAFSLQPYPHDIGRQARECKCRPQAISFVPACIDQSLVVGAERRKSGRVSGVTRRKRHQLRNQTFDRGLWLAKREDRCVLRHNASCDRFTDRFGGGEEECARLGRLTWVDCTASKIISWDESKNIADPRDSTNIGTCLLYTSDAADE